VTTTLPAGNHTYFFAVADSSTRMVYPGEPTVLSGPNVGAISAPAAPTEEFVVPANPMKPDSHITGVMD
jgi:hypothetical protein